MIKPYQIKTLKINGIDVGGRGDETILDLARENGIRIPTLCQIDGISNLGACRLCMVEVRGWNRLVPACVTFAEEGLEVHTNTERLKNYRRMILELLFSERNHICSVCVSNGHCELQDLAVELGMDHVRVPYLNPQLQLDASHPYFGLDQNRCVLCQRCVRVCDEIEGAHTWDLMGRGAESMIVSDLNEPWGESGTCTNCGKCVQLCPTGALFAKGRSVAEMIKQREFLPYLQMMREDEHA